MPRPRRPATAEPAVPISVRFPPTVRDAAKMAATADGRSFNTYVVRAVEAAIERDAKRR